jgi:Putative zinc-finger
MPETNLYNDNLACEQWEAMLAEAFDGLLTGEAEAKFNSHVRSCTACAQMLEEARRGQQWLQYVSREPAIPEDLVSRILAQTTGSATVTAAVPHSVAVLPKQPAWKRVPWHVSLRRIAEPRFTMTVAMAFFSIALTLNLVGVRGGNIHLSDLRPTTLRGTLERQFATASRPVIRYYDHLRFVYEFQAQYREFRRSEEQGDSGQPQKEQQQQTNHGGSAKKNGVPGKDGGRLNEPPRILRPAPVIAGHMMEVKLEWKVRDEKSVCGRYDSVEDLHGDQAERSLA